MTMDSPVIASHCTWRLAMRLAVRLAVRLASDSYLNEKKTLGPRLTRANLAFVYKAFPPRRHCSV